jgi:hypothetical protein
MNMYIYIVVAVHVCLFMEIVFWDSELVVCILNFWNVSVYISCYYLLEKGLLNPVCTHISTCVCALYDHVYACACMHMYVHVLVHVYVYYMIMYMHVHVCICMYALSYLYSFWIRHSTAIPIIIEGHETAFNGF